MTPRAAAETLRRIGAVLLARPLMAAAPAVAGAGVPAGIDGVWRTEPRASGAYITVRIQPCRDEPERRCGVIAGAHEGARSDIVGEQILRDMERQGDGSWARGQIIRPAEGTAYSSRLRLDGDDVLAVEGCVVGGLICRGQQWTRVE